MPNEEPPHTQRRQSEDELSCSSTIRAFGGESRGKHCASGRPGGGQYLDRQYRCRPALPQCACWPKAFPGSVAGTVF